MKQCLILLWVGLLFTTNLTYAQFIDPTAYGYYNYTNLLTPRGVYGSARTQATGGAGVAIGADVSAGSINPAGLGMYNKNDMGISLALGFSNNPTEYLQQVTKDGKSWAGIPSIGLTFYTPPKNENSTFQGSTFSIGFTKTSNLQNEFTYNGTNTRNSFTDYLAETSNGIALSDLNNQDPAFNGGFVPTIPGLGYYTYLTEVQNNGFNTYRPFTFVRGAQQTGTYSTGSGVYRWDASYGVNLSNKIYLGASLGIQSTRYKMEHTYTERVTNPSNDTLNAMSFTEYNQHRGSGVNFRIGLIYKVTDRVRLGFTAITPTATKIKEEYSFRMGSDFTGNNVTVQGFMLSSFDYSTPLNQYRYRFVSPARIEGGMAYFFNKNGFVTVALEYVPYTMSKVTDYSDANLFQGDNATIKNIYRDVINIKTGVEWRRDNLYYRAGFSYFPDPYNSNYDKVNRNQYNFCIGIGHRTDKFYIDAALVNTRTQSVYAPYQLGNGSHPQADIKMSSYQLTISTGLLY
ncbi:MAG: hypothetical protein MUE33_01155 [Cytophagaceae bacterium]|jgi:hypothetical protein|nr:hypothetical protein [Cytophagaceae bacterium]